MENNHGQIHPKMDRANRAKQFMPFDALKGFREALAEKEREIAREAEDRKDEENDMFSL